MSMRGISVEAARLWTLSEELSQLPHDTAGNKAAAL